MSFYIVRNDISKMDTDAVVNAANEELMQGAGVCGAIFREANDKRLHKECLDIGHCDTGSAVITKGYNLKAKYIIHAVGPVWHDGKHNENELLRSAYISSLKLAEKYECSSIALPLISTGIYGFPKQEALNIAISEIKIFLEQNEMSIYLVVYDKKSFKISSDLFENINRYIDENYVMEENILIHEPNVNTPYIKSSNKLNDIIDFRKVNKGKYNTKNKNDNLINIVNKLDDTFSQMLLKLIDEKGKTDVEIYKKANIDRKLFSKIRSNPSYTPKKTTAIAFAIALELNLDETNDLLNRAGYVLSHSNKFDVIIEYFIKHGNYNVYEINQALFTFDQMLIGA